MFSFRTGGIAIEVGIITAVVTTTTTIWVITLSAIALFNFNITTVVSAIVTILHRSKSGDRHGYTNKGAFAR